VSFYLLDTDVAIDYLHGIGSTVTLLEELVTLDHVLCTCALVVAEVYAGLRSNDEERWTLFLSTLHFFGSTQALAERAGRWR